MKKSPAIICKLYIRIDEKLKRNLT